MPEPLQKLPADLVLDRIHLPELDERPQNPILDSIQLLERRLAAPLFKRDDETQKVAHEKRRDVQNSGDSRGSEGVVWTSTLDDTTFERRVSTRHFTRRRT